MEFMPDDNLNIAVTNISVGLKPVMGDNRVVTVTFTLYAREGDEMKKRGKLAERLVVSSKKASDLSLLREEASDKLFRRLVHLLKYLRPDITGVATYPGPTLVEEFRDC